MGKWAFLIKKEFQWQLNNLFMRRKGFTCLINQKWFNSKQMKVFLINHISCQYITTFIILTSNDPVKRKETKGISLHESLINRFPLRLSEEIRSFSLHWCYLRLSGPFLIGTFKSRLTNTNILETFIPEISSVDWSVASALQTEI